ncbi:ATP-binding protein [Halothiobacillus sp.]|uniref:ATP-binding protein n=1 Tax=Halothiobacillus sp. TaxID=1891311 RepID=UPI00262464A2|nr:ATP-binding protein [Halothiobacillus sp.]MDD4965390.1 ATP-binding protein [Halothiobacillus sp.]
MSDPILITPRFRRSVRIDSDFASVTAIDGFYCPASFQAAVTFMASHVADTEQGAFTWTGPYGGGKSSLALALACLFGSQKPIRDQAAAIFGNSVLQALKDALPYFPNRWDVLPLVTERRSISEQLAERLSLPAKAAPADILSEIERKSKNRGLFIIMDELGRGLEAAAEGNGDLHLMQDIAELAARSRGKLIFLGILHQAFEEYAERLGHKARDSWAKIQGRFVDISISVSLEETIELIGEALGHHHVTRNALPLAEVCVEQLRPARKKSDAKHLARKLAQTSPLHPFTACLLGPLSRRRFGQNQRSIFSFLSSAEPYGLQDALTREVVDGFYPPYLLWNYLQANFEPAILSSPDGRRWALAHDVFERSVARGASDTEIKVLKTIAVLDLLKDKSGLTTHHATIALALHEIECSDVESALARLVQQSEIVFRKHSDQYMLYAGSDFDVEARLQEILAEQSDIDLNIVRALADLQPILAKRHHEKTGAIRWFEVSIEPVSDLETLPPPQPAQDIIGRVVFAMPTQGETPNEMIDTYERVMQSHKSYPLFIGHDTNVGKLLDLARELTGLSSLESRFLELRGDSVARREIDSRIAEVRQNLETSIHGLVGDCLWYGGSEKPRRLTKRQLNEQLSFITDTIFQDTPLIGNELLNCSEPSSNAVSARTKLMKRMVMRASDFDLGFAGKNYPAERGLYISLLKETGLHVEGKYSAPPKGAALYPLWREADRILAATEHGVVAADEIIKVWADAPIGLKAGLAPVFIVAYILSRRDRVAVYGEAVFQSSFNELCVEFLARDAKDIGLRRIEMEGFIGETLQELGRLLEVKGSAEPLRVARAIIGEFDALVPWTARTQSLSPQALQVREILKRASDPNKLLFDDLPRLTKPLPNGHFDPNATAKLLRDALAEMRASYPKALDELRNIMLRELDVRGQGEDALKDLRDRADNIRQIGGNLRLEAFVGRLTQFHGTREDMEGIASIAANKLPRDWHDGDLEQATVGLMELSTSFLKTETIARVKGRKDRRHALAVVMGKDNMLPPLFSEFEVADVDRRDVECLAETIDKALCEAGQQPRDIILAALIEVTSKYIATDNHHIVEST